MSARKNLVGVVAALCLMVAAHQAALAQVSGTAQVQFNATPPNVQVLTSHAAPNTTAVEPFKYVADTPAGHVEVGQSFSVTGANNWTVDRITVRTRGFGTSVANSQFRVDLWSVTDANATFGSGPIATWGDTFPPATNMPTTTPPYWTFILTPPATLNAGQSYGFTVGFLQVDTQGQRFVNLVKAGIDVAPFANGRMLLRKGTPPVFTPATDPITQNLDFSVQGTTVPPPCGPECIPPCGPFCPPCSQPNCIPVCAQCNVCTQTGTCIPNQFSRAVGGISINPNGSLQNATQEELRALRDLRVQVLEKIPAGLGDLVELRKVSLRGLEAAIAESKQAGKQLPDVVRCLAGLQRIRYVFVYPEQQDIVLVGPGEGWKVDGRGNVVGATTGRPVMLLDDLLVALRTARQAAEGGISCSIDPTPDGIEQLRGHVSTLKTIGDPQGTAAGIELVLGPQRITIHGVPASSHFARVLVAADYRMKRIAMGFEPSPVRGLPSFLQMIPATGRGMSNMLPRWWLEPNYAPIVHDGERLAWELPKAGVKAMTEEDFLTATGNKVHTGKASPAAQKWADLMTQKYDALARAEPVFGELQNCMDLAIVAALIVKERLCEKAGYSMPVLLDPIARPTPEFFAPKTVDSKASVLQKGRNWIISASGGVLVNSWQIAEKTQQSDAPAQTRTKSAPAKKTTWWWN